MPCHCILLRNAARKVTALYDEALAPVGITVGQYSLLRRVQAAGPVSLTGLAGLAGLERSTVGRNAKILQRMELLAATAGDDQREAVLDLTERGRQVLAEAMPRWETAQGKIGALLGPDSVSVLKKLVKAL